ncbi:MAG: alpha/beta hydrolase [Bacteroidia bacterium]
MKNKIVFTLLLLISMAASSYAYRMETVTYGNGYQMDCYIPSSFRGCPSPQDTDQFFYQCGPSNVTIMVLMHGGFFQFGSRSSMTPLAQRFAQEENMIILNIDYRKGWGYGSGNPCGNGNLALQQAAYRVVQDAYAAVNYFIFNAADAPFDISNPDKYLWNVFAGGYSSGAITALNMHATQEEFDLEAPILHELEGAITKSPGAFKFMGSLSIGGGVTNMAYFKPGTYNVLYHGENDPIVPFVYGTPISSNCTNILAPIYGDSSIYGYIAANNMAQVKLYTKSGGHESFAASLVDADFVVTHFISSVDAACYDEHCGMIPGPPFYTGENCPLLNPTNSDVTVGPLPNGINEYVSLNFMCLMYPRMANPNATEQPYTISDFRDSFKSQTPSNVSIYSIDGRLLERLQVKDFETFHQLVRTNYLNQVLVIEVERAEQKVEHFKYICIE